jgi:homoserine dehydrogenase
VSHDGDTRQVRLALIGLGTVGRLLLGLLVERKELIQQRYGLGFGLHCVADSSGIAVSDAGFDMEAVVEHKSRGGSVSGLDGFMKDSTTGDAFDRVRCDIVLEASPLDLESGDPGLSNARAALSRGLHLVLANKSPLALAMQELEELRGRNDCGMLYSATFCGGLPVLNIIRRDMVCGEVKAFRGIFNGTTNFILEELTNGNDYASALKKAQAIGAAEADPALDVGGWDTAAKLVIAANSFSDPKITLADIDVSGVENIGTDRLRRCREEGNMLKLLATAERIDGSWRFEVAPKPVPADSFLGGCNGWEMGAEIESDIYGHSYHKLYEEEPVPTAASMLRDTVHLALWGREAAR